MLIGAFSVGQTSPNIQTFASARGAAYKVYAIIDHVRKPPDPHSRGGICNYYLKISIFAAGRLSFRVRECASALWEVALMQRRGVFCLIGAPTVWGNFTGHLADVAQLELD